MTLGTYSNFWDDFSQIRGIIIFCSVFPPLPYVYAHYWTITLTETLIIIQVQVRASNFISEIVNVGFARFV